MPELPEVERARRTLAPAMEGARFRRVIARRPDLRSALPLDFAARLEGQKVRALRRRAKYLVAELSSGDALVMHLGMSGSFTVLKRTTEEFDPHDHVVFEMSSGSTIVFNDPRRFGSMSLVEGETSTHPVLAALGPEPLDAGFDVRTLASSFAGKRTSVKAALLDQRVVAGMGNIYVSEALHRARVSPKRRAATLVTRAGAAKPQVKALVESIRAVLMKALALDSEANDRFQVYDREGRHCLRRGCSGVIKRIVQSGRSTFFCPVCQK